MRVLIFEPDSSGHRLHYVRHIVSALLGIDGLEQITVALAADARSTPEFATHLADLPAAVQFDTWIPPIGGGSLRFALDRLAALRQSIDRATAQWLYVPYADGLSQVIGARRVAMLPGLPRGICTEGLMLRGGFVYPHQTCKATLAARLSWAAARRAPWTVMHVLDPLVYDRIKRNDPRLAQRCCLMPDPVEVPQSTDRLAARERLEIPTNGRYLAVVGLIDRRKGVDLLLRAFAKAQLCPRDKLLLVGRHEPAIQQLLAEPYVGLVKQGRIISIDRTVSTDELLDAIVACDVMCALYPRHIGSASTVIRAAAAARPTLGHNYGWIGHIVPRFELGWTCDATDPSALSKRLVESLDQAESFSLNESASRYVRFNSVENFQAHWMSAIRHRLGLAPAAGLLGWDDIQRTGSATHFGENAAV